MKILVIEDEPDMREVIIASLEKEKFLVESAAGYQTRRAPRDTMS